tara:strand:+ start:2446 stop:2565 length:120 start_codon:yes stop_codon:yes gene_type:complete
MSDLKRALALFCVKDLYYLAAIFVVGVIMGAFLFLLAPP